MLFQGLPRPSVRIWKAAAREVWLMKFLMAPAVVLLLLQLTAPTAARLFFSSRYVNPRYSFSGQEVRLTDRYLPL